MTSSEIDRLFVELRELRSRVDRLQWIVLIGVLASVGSPELISALRSLLV